MDTDLAAYLFKLSISGEYDTEYFPKSEKNEIISSLEWQEKSGSVQPSWISYNNANKSYELETIDINHLEYSIRNAIIVLLPNRIERVVNPFMECAYNLRKSQKSPRYEPIMYHATRPENIDSILVNNFNWRLNGSSRGHKHGKGVSFSPKPGFANMFCKSTYDKRMIVAKVMRRNVHVGHYHHELPNPGYDTTQSPNGNVYVKFEDCEFLPLYVVHY